MLVRAVKYVVSNRMLCVTLLQLLLSVIMLHPATQMKTILLTANSKLRVPMRLL